VTTSDKVELDHSIGFSGKVVSSVHLHPNAKDYVIIAGCSIVIGDLSDPHNQNFLTAHDDQITCLAIANQGHIIASGQKGDNSDIVLWDFASKRAIFRLSEHDYEVSLLDFSHDDRLLLSTGSQLDGKLYIWDTTNGYIVTKLNLIPTIYTEAPRCIKWGGYTKDIKLRNTANYQFAMSGAKKLNIWSLDPTNG
jgi:WD40 repeat protein